MLLKIKTTNCLQSHPKAFSSPSNLAASLSLLDGLYPSRIPSTESSIVFGVSHGPFLFLFLPRFPLSKTAARK